MSLWKWLLVTMAALSLAACGGGGSNAGTPVLGGNSGSVADVVIVLSSTTVANTGANAVTATITVVDANRAGLANVPVTASVDANAIISLASAKTDSTGSVTATIRIGSDQTNRTITVTAAAGAVTKSTTLKVVTDPNAGTPLAADMSVVLSAASITNGGSGTITATVTAVDLNRNVVQGIPVTLSVDSNAVAQVNATKTDDKGTVTATVGIGADRSNRVVTVTAVSGNLTRTAAFAVTGAKLTSSGSPLATAGSTGNRIEFTLVDFNGQAMFNQDITVTAEGMPTQSGKTLLNGKYTYTYTAPSVATNLSIVATAAGDQRTHFVTVSAAGDGVAVAPEFPNSASVTPTPSVVTVNPVGSTTNQVELRALFVGANNKPIPRMRARFDLAGNSNSTDGVISWVGSYAYSDENGIVRATFTPGLRSSPPNGVTIRMCYDVADFATTSNQSCEGAVNFATTTLTVSAEAWAVTIGDTNKVIVGPHDLTLIQEFVLMVVDSAGQPKQDAVIVPSIDLLGYFKGRFTWDGQKWDKAATWGNLAASEIYRWTGAQWIQDPTAGDIMCPNEDVNRNGVREASAYTVGAAAPPLAARGEDLNWSGSLEPRKSDVAISVVGSNRTNASGIAYIQIEYPRNYARWLIAKIMVTASGVAGTEARTQKTEIIPGLASDYTNQTVAPAGELSPYGTSSSCQDSK